MHGATIKVMPRNVYDFIPVRNRREYSMKECNIKLKTGNLDLILGLSSCWRNQKRVNISGPQSPEQKGYGYNKSITLIVFIFLQFFFSLSPSPLSTHRLSSFLTILYAR